MPTKESMGRRIALGRAQLGLSVVQLARRMAVKPKTLENWESDRTAPRGDKLMKLSGVLQVPLVWLLTGEVLEESDAAPSSDETAGISEKLERAMAMQQKLAALMIDISADVARLQRALDRDDVAA